MFGEAPVCTQIYHGLFLNRAPPLSPPHPSPVSHLGHIGPGHLGLTEFGTNITKNTFEQPNGKPEAIASRPSNNNVLVGGTGRRVMAVGCFAKLTRMESHTGNGGCWATGLPATSARSIRRKLKMDCPVLNRTRLIYIS